MRKSLKEFLCFLEILKANHKGSTHKERLNNYYSTQATYYDLLRPRILPFREELYRSVEINNKTKWADFGGGTAANFEAIEEKITQLEKVYIIDVCKPLLEIAKQRIEKKGWNQFEILECDSKKIPLNDNSLDVVTLSYSLTMTRDWIQTIDEALRVLKPGGIIAVIDFYRQQPYPDGELPKQSFFKKFFIPFWYSFANVWINSDHYPYLKYKFPKNIIKIKQTRLKGSPVYIDVMLFIGNKSG